MTGTDVRTGSCRYLLNQQTLNQSEMAGMESEITIDGYYTVKASNLFRCYYFH